LRLQRRGPELKNVRKSADNEPADYQERISELEKRLRAVVEEHRRMRRELEALEQRDPYRLRVRGLPSLPHVDDDARN
jgi:predicted  nucleic acid-binding Zn-ribbon protein